jgi:hypothetical protein
MQWTNRGKVRRWKREADKKDRLAEWHRWFAWYPVKVGMDWTTGADIKVWLATVMRRRVYCDGFFTAKGTYVASVVYDEHELNREEY